MTDHAPGGAAQEVVQQSIPRMRPDHNEVNAVFRGHAKNFLMRHPLQNGCFHRRLRHNPVTPRGQVLGGPGAQIDALRRGETLKHIRPGRKNRHGVEEQYLGAELLREGRGVMQRLF